MEAIGMQITGCNEAIISGDFEQNMRDIITRNLNNSPTEILRKIRTRHGAWYKLACSGYRIVDRSRFYMSLDDRTKVMYNELHGRPLYDFSVFVAESPPAP